MNQVDFRHGAFKNLDKSLWCFYVKSCKYAVHTKVDNITISFGNYGISLWETLRERLVWGL